MPVSYEVVEEELQDFLGKFFQQNRQNRDVLVAIDATCRQCWDTNPVPELAKIGTYLGNGELLDPDLRLLDQAMEQKLVQRIGPQGLQELNAHVGHARTYFDAHTQRGGDIPHVQGPYSKLLSSVLQENEQACGFTPTVPVYLGLLSADAFVEEAQKGRHFKDLISPQHGEFTHRIQWYLLSQKNFIERPRVVTLYRLVNMVPRLWDYMFDRVPGDIPVQAGSRDFRRPENLNDYLTTGESTANQFPLLSSFLRARRAKREPQLGSNGFRQTYAARKMFRKTYADLTTSEKARVDACVSKNLMVLGED